MKEVTASGLTVNEAVEDALNQLRAKREDVEITILDEGKRGILGIFGKRPATVHAKLTYDPVEAAKAFLANVVKKMGIDAKIETKQSGKSVMFQLTGDKLAILIGKRGQTLNSLQYLTQLVANRNSNHYIQITIDAEDYRNRRKAVLNQLASRLAQQVMRTSKSVSLEPMPSYERKIIHAALSAYKQINTHSVGEEPNRYLVISLKQKTDSK